MQDFLVRISNMAAAHAALPQWTEKDDDGNTVWAPPQWCGILPVDAYSALSIAPVMSDDGQIVVAPGSAAVVAAGSWFIVSIDKALSEITIPAVALPAIQAQCDRVTAMQMPAGIKGLSTLWAGMLPVLPG